MRSELLNDHAAVEFDHLRAVVKPIKRGFLGVQFVALESKVVRGFQGAKILRPSAAYFNRVECEFHVCVLLELFKMLKQGAERGGGKLILAPACTEGIDERILGDDGFHDVLNRAPIARHSLQLPEGKRGKSGFQKMRRTLAVGGDVDRFETAAIARTE